MMKPSSSDQDPQEEATQKKLFTGNSLTCRSFDFLGVSCSPSTRDQAEKTSDEECYTPVQFKRLLFDVPNTVPGCGFFDFFSSASFQTSKRRKEEESATMENDEASSNGGLNHHHDQQQQQNDIEKEAERLGISLELTLSCEFPKSNIKSGSNNTSSISKESVVCNSIEDNNQVKKSTATAATGVVEDPWIFHKKLTLTDINRHHTRLLLGKRYVEDHLLPKLGFSVDDKGKHVLVRDLDKNSVHHLTLATWAGGKNYVLIRNWYKNFVERRSLKEGDEIELCWNAAGPEFTFRILSRRTRGPREEAPS